MTEPTVEEALLFDCELEESPDKVWRALTEPALLAAWLLPNDFRAQLGARFQLDNHSADGAHMPIDCEVQAIEPARLLRYSWRERDDARSTAETVVTFTLTPMQHGGTLLRLVHSGPAARHEEARELFAKPRCLAARMLACATSATWGQRLACAA
jgi:uncharacterized protein YndB with AHSA1/START domain